MLTFGMRNLRRLENVDPVQIRPITILVGRNSSGKSSFLRSLPLLRQSLMTRTSSPILWYGDFVDFGSFTGAVTDNDPHRRICFTFELSDISVPINRRFSYYAEDIVSAAELEVGIALSPDLMPAASSAEKSQITSLRVKFKTDDVEYFLRVGGAGELTEFCINGEDCLELYSDYDIRITQGTFLPEFVMRSKIERPRDPFYVGEQTLSAKMGELIKPYVHRRIKAERLENYGDRLLDMVGFSKSALKVFAEHSTAGGSFKRLISDIADRDTKQLYARALAIHQANRFPAILSRLSQKLRELISSTLYIGPARARSERYYRYQDLAVSEIDPDGRNFPMFLNSLNPAQLSSLSDWIERLFKYRIKLEPSAGHLSINLTDGSHSVNVVDTGYGISQILPVLGQIWWAANRPRVEPTVGRLRSSRSRETILAIEQPELHLHPAHQALLADAFAAQISAEQKNNPLMLVVETHSETLLNRLGQLIADQKLDSDAVQVLIFEPSDIADRYTEVQVAHFGSQGELIDWPYGFFQPTVS